jgi:hypothetical protein
MMAVLEALAAGADNAVYAYLKHCRRMDAWERRRRRAKLARRAKRRAPRN